MRVAFIDQTGDLIGGAQDSLALLLTHLPPTVEPIVVLFHDGTFAERLRASGFQVEIMQIADAIASSTRDRISLRGLAVIPRAIIRLATLLKNRRVDLVYTHTVKAHFIGAPAAFLSGTPCVVHLRDILTGKSNLALRLVIRAFTHAQIAISHAVARAYALPTLSVIPNPVDVTRYVDLPDPSTSRAALGLPRVERVIVAIVGRINRWKGHDRFVRAAAAARARSDDLFFAIVGEPRFGDADFVIELRRTVEELGITDHVAFLPWQSDLPMLYSALDILVNCSKREPFGRTIIEAGAATVPSICFDDSGAGEFMNAAGLGIVVPANDDAALVDAIVALGTDRESRRLAGAAAKVWAQTFDARVHAKNVVEVFERIA